MKPLTISEALEVLKISKATLYRDMKYGKISYNLDEKNHRVIDINELIRVYGNENIQFKKIDSDKMSHNDTYIFSKENNNNNVDLNIKNKEIELLKEILDEKNNRIYDLNKTVNILEEQLNKANLILENISNIKNKNDFFSENEINMKNEQNKKRPKWRFFWKK